MELFRGPKAKRAMSRVTTNRGLEIFPGIRTDMREYLALMEEAGDELTSHHKADVDAEGIASENAVTGNFYGLRNVAGYYMHSVNAPPITNQPIRDELGLAQGFLTSRHQAIWRALWDAMFVERRPASLRIARDSSTTFPYFEFDMEFKKTMFAHLSRNVNEILRYVEQDDLEELYQEMEVIIGYYMNVRSQPDSVTRDAEGKYHTKGREVGDYEYARSGGRRGRRFEADKTVTIDGHIVPGHFAMRRRSVYGMSATVNYLFGAMFTGFREHYLNEYKFTWKHTTQSAITDKLRQYQYFVGFDVKQFDQTVAGWMIEYFLSLFDGDWDPRFIKMLRMAFHAPYYLPQPEVGGKPGGFWMGNPMKASNFRLEYGLPSGIACNPDFGKYVMTATYLCVLDDHFGDVLEFGVSKVLRGEHPHYALLDMGDDAVLLTSSQRFIDHCHQSLTEGKRLSQYFSLAKEEGVSFLGNAFYRHPDGLVHLAPNIVSFFERWFVPERGIGGKFRQLWYMGWRERKAYYSEAPAFSDCYQIFDSLFERHFGCTMDRWVAQTEPEDAAFRYTHFSDVDRIVLDDPSKMYYRFTPEDVSPEVLDALVGTIDVEEVEQFIHRIRR